MFWRFLAYIQISLLYISHYVNLLGKLLQIRIRPGYGEQKYFRAITRKLCRCFRRLEIAFSGIGVLVCIIRICVCTTFLVCMCQESLTGLDETSSECGFNTEIGAIFDHRVSENTFWLWVGMRGGASRGPWTSKPCVHCQLRAGCWVWLQHFFCLRNQLLYQFIGQVHFLQGQNQHMYISM